MAPARRQAWSRTCPLPDRTNPCSCGRRGCLQAAVSDRALGLRAAGRDRPGQGVPSPAGTGPAGDRRAVGLFRERARLVGAAAALLFDLLNPELLVVTEAGASTCPNAWRTYGPR